MCPRINVINVVQTRTTGSAAWCMDKQTMTNHKPEYGILMSFSHSLLEHCLLLLERYDEDLRRELAFCLLASERILAMLGPVCTDAASILHTNMLFLKDFFGLHNGYDPVAALSAELQSLSLTQPNVSMASASLQVKIF